MLIKFMRSHLDAKLPTQAEGDVGFDLYSVEDQTIKVGRVSKVKTGLHIADYDPQLEVVKMQVDWQVQPPFRLTVYPKIEGRSSLGSKGIFTVAGIIDPTYRAELCVVLANMTGEDYDVKKGDKIAQFVFYTCLTTPELRFEETSEVTPTQRGDKGFGSTGR